MTRTWLRRRRFTLYWLLLVKSFIHYLFTTRWPPWPIIFSLIVLQASFIFRSIPIEILLSLLIKLRFFFWTVLLFSWNEMLFLIEVRLKILTPQLPLAKVPFFIITKIVLIPGVPADRRSFPKSWEPIDWSVRILIKILFLKTTKIVRAATWPEKPPISRHLYLVVAKISPKEIGLKG
jgi:hypothetical protein